jgi:6-phosphogluconolactonase
MAAGGIYVYVSHQGARQISVLRMSPATGELNRIQDVPVAGDAMPMAVSPDRRFLFAALRTDPFAFASFAIDAADGTLIHLADAPAPESAAYISTDHTGRFLFSACNPSVSERRTGFVSVSAISRQGYVFAPHQVIRTPPKTHAVLRDPANRYVLASSCDGDVMVRFAFDSAAGLLDADALPPVLVRPGAGPRHFVFHPNDRFMYLVNEYDASLYTFAYDVRKGALAELQTSSAFPPDVERKGSARAADLHFTPDGRWLYVSVRSTLTLAAFKVDVTTGGLTPAGHFPTVDEPRGFNIDPFGRYLIAAGRIANKLAAYRIDPETGALGKLAEYPTAAGPNWIEIVRLP